MTVRVLIADDEPNQLELVGHSLGQAGFDVVTCADGADAIAKTQSMSPDIVILDWMMPKMSGIEVCRAMRDDTAMRAIPVIMLSARGEEGDRILGLDIGADDYIAKPFSPRELVSRVRAVLRRTRPDMGADVLESGDIRLYPAHKTVERGGEAVHLGPKEFAILALLIERPGQVFSRAQLLDRIWGHGVFVDDRTIDVHMSRLRKALNAGNHHNGEDAIRTVRGSGYALYAPSAAKTSR